MLAYDYPILGLFWTMLMLFVWIAWIFLLFRIFADIFRSDDLGGWAKAIWSIFVIVVPFIGVFVYLIARGDSMARRDVADAQASEAAMQDYIRQAAGTSASPADELAKLKGLHDQGVLTDDEFAQQKAKLLASS
jgi:hypothetical protein